MDISPIAAFDDNYIWLLRDSSGEVAIVVDPGDEDPVLERLQREGLSLGGILLTHKHGDHTGGVADLLRAWPGVPVFGPAGEPIRGLTVAVKEGDLVSVPGVAAEFRVMDVPGHTEGHVAYYGEGALFCGDTLFASGCGRVFSGTHQQLHDALQRIAQLPPETLIYCAHEYTEANIGFARWVEPENPTIQLRQANARRLRDAGEPTVPSTLELELETNPFMRTAEPAVIAAATKYAARELADGGEVFTAIREWKDREYD
ncbi:MAG: hydroxyacylglutathione hydrolase [Candidatus Sedimenticola sp. (ex Thyasira tokunagai)]